MDFDIVVQYFKFLSLSGAENETRTRDPDLGKVVLYQLSYFRVGNAKVMLFFERANFSSIFFSIFTEAG